MGNARCQFMHITRHLLVAVAGLAIGLGAEGARGAWGAQGAWGARGAPSAPSVVGPNFSSVVGPNFSSAMGGEQSEPNLDTLRRAFLSPPDDARIMMRWWWFGPAVTDEELARELEVMKAGGIGGVEVQPVYPVALDGDGIHTEAYLSEAFLKHLRAASDKAGALGLRFDLTLGSGWPYGGPSVAVNDAASRLRIERVPVPAGSERVQLPDIGAGEAWLAALPVVPGTTTPTNPAAAPLKSPRDGRCRCAGLKRRARAAGVHRQPHGPAGEARGSRRRRLRRRPLQPARARRLSPERRRPACGRRSRAAVRRTRSSATASKYSARTGPRIFSKRSAHVAATTCWRTCPRSQADATLSPLRSATTGGRR